MNWLPAQCAQKNLGPEDPSTTAAAAEWASVTSAPHTDVPSSLVDGRALCGFAAHAMSGLIFSRVLLESKCHRSIHLIMCLWCTDILRVLSHTCNNHSLKIPWFLVHLSRNGATNVLITFLYIYWGEQKGELYIELHLLRSRWSWYFLGNSFLFCYVSWTK